MLRKITFMMFVVALSLMVAVPIASADRGGEGGRGDPNAPVIYVTSQGLYYDSIVTADPVPNKGPFQDLLMVEVDGQIQLQTQFGPGDQGYVGGRWRLLDQDGNVVKYFVCPLLGPGRESP